ncbi:MAG: phosphonate C-P lyase system protein PhnH [Pseudomonadota bacterium]|jgi:alpha-D-ribose 1-methylphosphonate 5-triphosphate synthase subunit PhnH|nr:phosphonate C-P lyase system protein PhnH [Pseudomonadota bacterium]MEC7301643.1 phosphonate C-P lyase system protein PhnH [Pseudomonadota bacterium]MEC7396376.1 phosphonate C-P lyase system protein PhnH [Pseudomonadota bacterium]MEC7538118.1 phosphonate C-P lyase system protein PhnH [Pseudomonadota bacterium]MEC7574297.1 phosphonate C-P lyase system protein PhnH [Pseudomonadota bacterium]
MPEAVTTLAGFEEPVQQAQAVFRALLDAMAQPARVVDFPTGNELPDGIEPASASVLLCLLDPSTRTWIAPQLDAISATTYFRFHTGCGFTSIPGDADFALINGVDSDLILQFAIGTPEYPDRSTTVLVQVDALSEGVGPRLTGPGIESERRLTVEGVPTNFWENVRLNNSNFPLGIDIVLICGDQVACLPRSTKVEV